MLSREGFERILDVYRDKNVIRIMAVARHQYSAVMYDCIHPGRHPIGKMLQEEAILRVFKRSRQEHLRHEAATGLSKCDWAVFPCPRLNGYQRGSGKERDGIFRNVATGEAL